MAHTTTRRTAAALAGLLLALLPAAAHADQPVITDVAFSPAGVDATGGTVTVSAQIQSPAGIASAEVSVQFANGGTGGGAMHRASPGSDYWSIDVTVPPNLLDVPVTHSVNISATGTDGETQNADVGSIPQDAVDTSDQPPTIEVTAVAPQFLLSSGGQVRLQATAHDDHAIAEVYAVVTGPGGPITVPMSLFSPSDYEGYVDIPANTQPNVVSHTVTAHVVDDLGQTGEDQGPNINVDPFAEETEPPVISDVVVSPSTVPAAGGTVTISATITSSAGVASAGFTVNLNGGSGGQVGTAMTRTAPGSDVWSGDVAIPANGSNDPLNHPIDMAAEGNDGGSALEIVGSIDQEGQPQFDQAPYVSISSVSPTDLDSGGGTVTIQASASDDRSVSEVHVTVTGPSGTDTVSLSPTGGDAWEGTFSAPANPSRTAPVTYTTQATAIDDAGQSSFADGPSISVAPVPNAEPTITNPAVTPTTLPAAGGTVTISAEVADPDGDVAGVHADITHPDGQVTSLTMTQATPDAPYRATWTAPANGGEEDDEHTVTIAAVDGEGGASTAGAGSVTVAGVPPFDELPDVFDTTATPTSLPATGGQVVVAASATDDRSVSEVYAVVTAPGGTTTQLAMEPTSGTRFEGTLTLPANPDPSPKTYALRVVALDDIGQEGFEDADQVTVAAAAPTDQPPAITGAKVTTSRILGLDFGRISATVTDDHGLKDVHAKITDPSGAITQLEMSAPASSSAFSAAFFPPPPTARTTYTVQVVATDSADQTSTAPAGTLTVAPTATPPPPPPPTSGPLQVSTDKVRFGRVRVGDRITRELTVTNPAAAGTPAVVATLLVRGARFALPQGTTTLTLQPGETRTLRLSFSPTAAGKRTGRLALGRSDGASRLVVRLAGRGVEHRG